MGGSVSVLIIN